MVLTNSNSPRINDDLRLIIIITTTNSKKEKKLKNNGMKYRKARTAPGTKKGEKLNEKNTNLEY